MSRCSNFPEIQKPKAGGNYVFLTSQEGTILTHPNEDIALSKETNTTVADALGGKYKFVYEKQLATKLIWDYKGGPKFVISNVSKMTGWTIIALF